jgi:sec-independent protein translocase protein TatC
MAQEQTMSFLDHLEALRWHLIRIAGAVMLCSSVVFVWKSFFIDDLILGPRRPDFVTYQLFCQFTQKFSETGLFCFTEMPFELLNTRMAGQFTTHLWVAILGGIVICFPYIVWEIWRFIAPGLHENERKASRGIIWGTSMLFFLGISFGYFLIAPLSVQFLGTYSVSEEVVNRIDLVSFIRTISSVTLASGILFELPIAVYFLSRAGIVTPEGMKMYRRHAIVAVLLLSAIITPPDILSQILVSVPVLILYEFSIGISRRQLKHLNKKAAL